MVCAAPCQAHGRSTKFSSGAWQTNGVVWAFADSEAEAVPEPTGEDFKRAVSVLLPYLLSHRTRLASLEDSSDAAEPTTSAAQAGSHLLKA